MFVAEAQNKFLYAVTGQTSAEIIMNRVDATKENMGLTSWEGRRINKADVIIAKNYLTKEELDILNRIVVIFLDSAELRAKLKKSTTISFWRENIDLILSSNGFHVLNSRGSRSNAESEEMAKEEYEKFKAWRKLIALQEADKEDAEDIKRLTRSIEMRKQ